MEVTSCNTVNLQENLLSITKEDIDWKKIKSKDLDIDYAVVMKKSLSTILMKKLQESVHYFSDEKLTQVKVFGKWHPIPRQQSAYGDEGITYKYSGTVVPATPWIPVLKNTRDFIQNITGYSYNFVLINRYRNGSDHMGEHKDDEAELDINTPIASLSLGQNRDFIFRHENSRKRKAGCTIQIPPVKLNLEHGSLLLMNHPTNKYWYHSLPQRKKLPGERINLTFRKIIN